MSSARPAGHGSTTVAAAGDRTGHHHNGWVVFTAFAEGRRLYVAFGCSNSKNRTCRFVRNEAPSYPWGAVYKLIILLFVRVSLCTTLLQLYILGMTIETKGVSCPRSSA